MLEWAPRGPVRGTVLLLHGGGYDSAALSWGGVGAALAGAGYRVIAPDVPGYGESPAATWVATQERLVAWVGEVVDALGVQGCVLGGLSMGGGMALGYTLTHPGSVAALMLFGTYGLATRITAGPGSGVTQLLGWASLRSGLLGAVMPRIVRSRRLVSLTVRALVPDPARRTPDLLNAVREEGLRGTGSTSFAQWQSDQMGPTRLRSSYADQLGSLTLPVLVVHGASDVGVPVTQIRAAVPRFPDAHLVVVSGGGHWIQRDQPDVVVAEVLAFLDRTAPRPNTGGPAR